MRCPKCQTEVLEGHFYCPSCRVSVYGYLPEQGLAGNGRLERAGRRLLDLVLLLALIGGGVVLARAIKWKELLNGFSSSAEVTPSAKPTSSGSSTKRHAANPRQEPQNATKPSSGENTAEPKSDPEKSPSKSEGQSQSKSAATPTPSKPTS